MLVSHRYQFIYLKTKKTAGTSVEYYFEPYCMHSGEWRPTDHRDEYASSAGIIGYRGEGRPEHPLWWKHMPAALIKKTLGETIWNHYFKFCTIRNPYEKVISAFYFQLRLRGERLNDHDNHREHFEKWLENTTPPTDHDVYLINGDFVADDYIRFERLHEDMERICRQLGIPWNPASFPTLKKGIRPPQATAVNLYSDKSKKIVEKLFAFELRFFNYSFPA